MHTQSRAGLSAWQVRWGSALQRSATLVVTAMLAVADWSRGSYEYSALGTEPSAACDCCQYLSLSTMMASHLDWSELGIGYPQNA